ncbi:hypothetical protein OROMI_006303 [Orobanche minor]
MSLHPPPPLSPPPRRRRRSAQYQAPPSSPTPPPLSTNNIAYSTVDKASAFESSNFFSEIPLQPIPRSSISADIKSSPILRSTGPGSGLIERGFMSGPIERSFISGPVENHFDYLQRFMVSEEHGWDFVGIYDGFNGPDATNFLLNNLYLNVHKELKGLLWCDKGESCEDMVDRSSFMSKSLDSKETDA